MQEIEELIHSLAHQSEACYLTVTNNQRMHAYAMVGDLARLEARLYSKRYPDLGDEVTKCIHRCIMCIKSTATTGKVYDCSRNEIKNIENKIKNLEHSKWERPLSNE